MMMMRRRRRRRMIMMAGVGCGDLIWGGVGWVE
jgi:hypothetical protein